MTEINAGEVEPKKIVLVQLKQTKLIEEHRHTKWQLIKIKQVPLPEPTWQLRKDAEV